MVELRKTQLATDDDRAYGIDKWARFFAATTWEEIKMLANTDTTFEKAANYMLYFTDDSEVQEELRHRQEMLTRQRLEHQRMLEQEMLLKEKDNALAEKDAEIQRLKQLLEAAGKNGE